jgi:hypothetical protein
MKRILFLSVIVLQLVACAGGGGGSGAGPGGGSPQPMPGNKVPFSTPVKVYTHDPLVGTNDYDANSHVYTAKISSTTSDDVLITGSFGPNPAIPNQPWTDSKISLLSWQNGTLVDKTAQWFPNGTNRIVGALDLKMADFSNSGRNDLFVVTGTDINYLNYVYFYKNNGTSFERQTIPLLKDLWSHDSVVTDLNRDGYKDIILTSYGPNTHFMLNNKAGSFTPYVQEKTVLWNTSSIAAGDFLNNNTTSLIATDPFGPGTASRLYTWSLTGQNFNLQEIATLPAPRFTLPKWQSYNFGDGQGASHDIRAVAKDFNDDKVTDVIIFSRPWLTKGKWPNYSEIQFLKNNGGGSFTDVTDSTLVGYNTSTSPSYQPRFFDVNNDGLEDILVSGVDPAGSASHQFLLKTKEGKYVSSYTNILSAFANQTFDIEKLKNSTATANYNTITLVQGPNNKLYLLTYINTNSGDKQMSFYLSEIGTNGPVLTPQATMALIKQTWPWMSDAQVNTVLAQSSTSWFGLNLLDPEKALKPIGTVGLPLDGRGIVPIRGYLTGVDMGDGTAVVTDSLGRAFSMNLRAMNINRMNAFGYNTEHNDQYEMTSHAEYLVNGSINNVNGIRVGTDWAGRDNTGMGLNKPTQYTVGVPRWFNRGNWSMGTQYTYLNSNPWMAFGGAWGEVNGSGITDNVVTYQRNGFSAQASLMHVSTNITPGLINKVSDMWGTWAETGYRFGNVKREGLTGIFLGVKPVVLSGSVQARMPTGVDNSGNITYTSKKLMIQNQTTGYVRALYTNQLDRRTQLRLSAVATTGSQYRIMNELKYWFD